MDPDCKEILRKLARHFKNLKAGENAIPFSQNLYRLLPSNSKKLEHRHGFCPSKARQGSRGLLLLNLSICIYVIYTYIYMYIYIYIVCIIDVNIYIYKHTCSHACRHAYMLKYITFDSSIIL